jgi:phosphohistidine swiveling domain-containing protein
MSAVARTAVVHFKLRGADFTRLLRDLMLSEEPAKAWRLIVNGLRDDAGNGSVERYAAKILDGELRLVGDETVGMDVKPDRPAHKETKKYLDSLRFIYAGRVRISSSWWRPRAEVTDVGPDDAEYASQRVSGPYVDLPHHYTQNKRWNAQRVAFYKSEGERVVEVERVAKNRRWNDVILFEPVGEPPFWWPECRDPSAALVDFLAAGRKLDQESWSERFGDSRKNSSCDSPFAKGTKDATKAASEREEDERTKSFNKLIEDIRIEVKRRSADDFLDLTLDNGEVLAVPRAPFLQWALHRTSLAHLAPAWTPVSPVGLKLQLDDPFHTDWLLGAGCNVEEAYQGAVHDASWKRAFEIQEELGHFECGVVVDAGPVHGTVGQEIVVLPDLHPDHIDMLLSAKGVITEAGGQLAHLAQVATERGITIMRVDGACARLPEGTKLALYPAEGKIDVDIERR